MGENSINPARVSKPVLELIEANTEKIEKFKCLFCGHKDLFRNDLKQHMVEEHGEEIRRMLNDTAKEYLETVNEE